MEEGLKNAMLMNANLMPVGNEAAGIKSRGKRRIVEAT